MKHILIITALLFSVQMFAQEEVLRPEKTLKIAIDASNYYTTDLDESYYQQDENSFQVYVEDVVFVELELKKKKVISLTVVEENTNPERTVVFDFSQKTKGALHQAMILRVTNPFEYSLTFSTEKMGIDELWSPTKVGYFQPNMLGYEYWNEIIASLLISDIKLK